MTDLQLLSGCLLLAFASISAANSHDYIGTGRPFSLKTKIATSQKDRDDAVVVEEYYSLEQKRARIHYSSSKEHNTNANIREIYYDAKIPAGVVRGSRFQFTCERANLTQMKSDIYLGIGQSMDELLQLIKPNADLDHVIGPAKLLYLLAQHANDLRAAPPVDQINKIRNHPVAMYLLKLQVPAGEVVLHLFYDKETSFHYPATDAPPIMTTIVFPNSTNFMYIDFFEFKALSEDRWLQTSGRLNGELILDTGNRDDKLVDFFAFPATANCLDQVPESAFVSLIKPREDNSSVRLSFRATTDSMTGRRRHFTAYDGVGKMVRLDSFGSSTHNLAQSNSHYRTTIMDIKTNRKYIVDTNEYTYEKMEFNFTVENIPLEPNRCIATYMENPDETKRKSGLDLEQFLFGGHKFKYLGRARIRGIDAQVYEGNVTEMPDWFLQRTVYKSPRNEFMAEKKSQLSGGERPMSGVLYVSAGSELGDIHVLQLDIYYLDFKVPAEFREALLVEFSNFVWDLSDSPRGEPVDVLFSFGDLCVSNHDANRRVDLILTKKLYNNATYSKWIGASPRQRNEALQSAIIDSLDIHAMGVKDLESKVTQAGNLLTLTASFVYVDQPQNFFSIRSVGKASFTGKTSDVMFLPASSLNDCLWALGEAPNLRRLFYSHKSLSCIVEIGDTKKKLTDLFRMTEHGTGELYYVSSQPDTLNSLTKTWLSEKKFQHLEGRPVVLRDFSPGASDLEMKLDKIKIQRVNSLDSAEQKSQPASSLVLTGFTVSSSLGFVREVTLKVNSEGDKASQKPISWDLCEAACLEDFDCESFSYCFEDKEATCLLSSVRLLNANVMDQLKKRKSQTDSMWTGGKLEVTVEKNQQVELQRDFKCELHNKNHLKMFRNFHSVSKVDFKGLQVFPVEHPSECAAKCFEISMKTIEDSGKLNEQIRSIIGDESQSGEQLKRSIKSIRGRHREMMANFCYKFMYLNSALDEEQLKVVQKVAGSGDSSAYCVLREPISNDQQVAEWSSFKNKLDLDYYEFDFSSLYEKQFGFKMLGSSVTIHELNAFSSLERNEELTGEEYDLLKLTIKEHKNFVSSKKGTAISCAHGCFLQTNGLWPACQSFDLIINNYHEESKSITCQMNTESRISNPEARLQQDTAKIKLIHYEPRFQFVKDIGDSSYQLDELMDSIGFASSSGWQPFWTVMLILFGLVTGVFSGVRLANMYLVDHNDVTRQPIEPLERVDWNKTYVNYDDRDYS